MFSASPSRKSAHYIPPTTDSGNAKKTTGQTLCIHTSGTRADGRWLLELSVRCRHGCSERRVAKLQSTPRGEVRSRSAARQRLPNGVKKFGKKRTRVMCKTNTRQKKKKSVWQLQPKQSSTTDNCNRTHWRIAHELSPLIQICARQDGNVFVGVLRGLVNQRLREFDSVLRRRLHRD